MDCFKYIYHFFFKGRQICLVHTDATAFTVNMPILLAAVVQSLEAFRSMYSIAQALQRPRPQVRQKLVSHGLYDKVNVTKCIVMKYSSPHSA